MRLLERRSRLRTASWSLLIAMLAPLVAADVPAPLADLSGTAWQLVDIKSMDDSMTRPGSAGAYTLVFGIDGSVTAQADCNRATGSLAVFSPPSLQFDQFAATSALCGPDSISEPYLRELGWVRSYVYRDGRLHLATMADGSILAFDPLADDSVTAQVLDLALVLDDADALRSIALSALLNDFARSEEIRATEAAVDSYLAEMEARMREDLGDAYEDGSDLSADEQLALADMRRSMAAAMIRNWEINRRLYEKYGGRVIYQQFGPEPLDAYVAFLREAEQAGRLTIRDAALAEAFWRFFNQEERHDFYPDAEASEAFATPPWAQAEQQ